MRSAIHDFKYRNAQDLADPLVGLLEYAWPQVPLPVDVLVPIPLHRRRQRQRGYNQAALLARELGRRCGVAVVENAVRRVKDTAPQVGMDLRQRRENMSGAFRCAEGALRGQTIVLIDDVCTTGATLEACALAVCEEGGAHSAWALTVARARETNDDTRAAIL